MTGRVTQEFQVNTAEHEILLSFDNDEDAEYFMYWWDLAGSQAFEDALPELKEGDCD